MATISVAMAIAEQHHQAGRLQVAEQLCRQILLAEPNQAAAWNLLGVINAQTGNSRPAVEYFNRALALNSDWAEAHNNLGNVLAAEGKPDEAVACYRRALKLKPNLAMAHHNLGSALRVQGKLDEAAACARQALKLAPTFAEAHDNLGTVLAVQGKLDEAVACYRQALRLKPNFAEAHDNLGTVLAGQGKLDEAVACYRQALTLKPTLAEAHHNLGTVLVGQGKLDEAAACCRQALKLKPHFAEAHHNLGTVLAGQGKLDEAVACCRQALKLMPTFAEAHDHLGTVLAGQGKLDEAVASYRRALELKPDFAQAHSNLGNALKGQGKLDEAVACYRRALELKPDFAEVHSNLLLTLQYCAGVTPAALAEAHAEYDRRHAVPLRGVVAQHENVHDRHDRLRLGFVSPDLGRHAVSYFLVRVLENLSQEQHDTIFYSDRKVKDDLTRRFQAVATQWHDVSGMSDQRLAEQIRADRIDILFDLAGHTAGNRLLAFARKPAPIQITWIGYTGTTGLAAMDYLLANRRVVPEGTERYYRERVLRMPEGYLCYDPPDMAPPVGPLPSLTKGHTTFCSFNNPAKITPQVVAVWAEILRRVPNARLVLKYRGMSDLTVKRRYLDLFAAHGAGPQRLELQSSSSFVEYLATYQQVDVALDPFPFSGCTTTCEALWMGVPVITCPGETFASRDSFSHLSSLGLTETIARDLDEYVELAVSLAADLPRLAALRAGLRQRMAVSPLCDGKRFASNLASLLRGMWEQWTRTRGQRVPSLCSGRDLEHASIVPTAIAASYGQVIFVGMPFQKRQREATQPSTVLAQMSNAAKCANESFDVI